MLKGSIARTVGAIIIVEDDENKLNLVEKAALSLSNILLFT